MRTFSKKPTGKKQNNAPIKKVDDPAEWPINQSTAIQPEYFRNRSGRTGPPLTTKPNRTSIPDELKGKIEERSGLSLDDVIVHHHSEKPAALGALAYTQGNQVYLGPGQENHLEHELGHVVQQKQGIVKPTTRLNGVNINDYKTLEFKANAPVFEMIGTDPVNGDVVQRALVGEFGFDNADPIEQKLQYFKRQDLGIEKWILTAYEFEKQNELLTVAPDAPAMVTVPVLMDKLYSLREMVCNTVTVAQQQPAGTQQTGPVDPLLKSESSATTKMNLAADDKLSMVTHGMDADFLVIEEIAPLVPPPNPDIVKRYKTHKQVPGQYYHNDTDTIRYYHSDVYVAARSDHMVAHLRGALPVMSQPNFNPFFCFMGNSKETQDAYKAHVPSVDISDAQVH